MIKYLLTGQPDRKGTHTVLGIFDKANDLEATKSADTTHRIHNIFQHINGRQKVNPNFDPNASPVQTGQVYIDNMSQEITDLQALAKEQTEALSAKIIEIEELKAKLAQSPESLPSPPSLPSSTEDAPTEKPKKTK